MQKENAFKKINEGWISVITGPMFSGKTTEMLQIIKRYKFAGVNAIAFKNKIDVRSKLNYIQSRDGYVLDAIEVGCAKDILTYIDKNKVVNNYQIIAIDEVQFFDNEIIEVIKTLADKKFIVICSGLDLDYNGNPFGPMPILLSIADDVLKLKAVCTQCGGPATKTFLINNHSTSKINPIVIGDKEMFEARCNKHFKYHK